MRAETQINPKELYQAMEKAAEDLFGFGVVLNSGGMTMAEQEILDILFLGLENYWFTRDDAGGLSHKEFREEFFRVFWERNNKELANLRIGIDVPLGHEEMKFYKLPLFSRAVLFLRTKKKFDYPSISLIMSAPVAIVREELEKSREFILGRGLPPIECSEEDF